MTNLYNLSNFINILENQFLFYESRAHKDYQLFICYFSKFLFSWARFFVGFLLFRSIYFELTFQNVLNLFRSWFAFLLIYGFFISFFKALNCFFLFHDLLIFSTNYLLHFHNSCLLFNEKLHEIFIIGSRFSFLFFY